jgi:hypothetical protein
MCAEDLLAHLLVDTLDRSPLAKVQDHWFPLTRMGAPLNSFHPYQQDPRFLLNF